MVFVSGVVDACFLPFYIPTPNKLSSITTSSLVMTASKRRSKPIHLEPTKAEFSTPHSEPQKSSYNKLISLLVFSILASFYYFSVCPIYKNVARVELQLGIKLIKLDKPGLYGALEDTYGDKVEYTYGIIKFNIQMIFGGDLMLRQFIESGGTRP